MEMEPGASLWEVLSIARLRKLWMEDLVLMTSSHTGSSNLSEIVLLMQRIRL